MPYKKEVKVNKEKGNTLVKVGGSKPSFEKLYFLFLFFSQNQSHIKILIIFIQV